jgi:16S rRNA (cytidine1402-2'-O)-methyltransferase
MNASLSYSPITALAREVTAPQMFAAPALYVVATPIGNLADVTLRALAVLAMADLIAAEDTRVAVRLLQAYGIDGKRLVRCDAHTERECESAVLGVLAQGARVALVSDAGTPAVSDPGAALVQAVRDAGHVVVPVPGASSVLTLLSAAGFTATAFRFDGFAPAKRSERDAWLRRLKDARETMVFFEAPHRIAETLRELAASLGHAGRRVALGRELTKRFETIAVLPLAEVPAWLAQDAQRVQGEWVVALEGAVPEHATAHAGEHDALLGALLKHLPLKTAVAVAEEISGTPKNLLYQRALDLKAASGADDCT